MEDNKLIEKLLNANEGEHIQFKEAKNRYSVDDASKICCALANCGGGDFVLGISDERPRKVVGTNAFEQPESTRRRLMDNLKINVTIQEYLFDGKRILIFKVAPRPQGTPVQYDGRAWYYNGDSLIPMPEEIRREIYSEIDVDFSCGICKGASINDLDKEAISNFRKSWAEKSGNKRHEKSSDEQLLFDCGAITDEGVTYAAIILFGKRAAIKKFLPQAEIVFEYRSSNAAGPAAQRENFQEGFFKCYDQIWNLINLRNDKQHYQQGFFIFDIPTFNERVIREAILNAVCHRNYQMIGSIFIRQYRDRLVVESPGGFPYGISLDNILDRQCPRNRLIADILEYCGLVERSGQGMNIIYESTIKEAKQLPDFTGTDDSLVRLTLNGLIIKRNMLSIIGSIGEEKVEDFSTDELLTINALYHDMPLSEKMKFTLPQLENMGIVEHAGRGKYVLARRLYEAAGEAGVYTRKVGLDRETNKELILKHIRDNGDSGTPVRELQQVLPNLSKSEIHVLLRELKNCGKIYAVGNTLAARWYIGAEEK